MSTGGLRGLSLIEKHDGGLRNSDNFTVVSFPECLIKSSIVLIILIYNYNRLSYSNSGTPHGDRAYCAVIRGQKT